MTSNRNGRIPRRERLSGEWTVPNEVGGRHLHPGPRARELEGKPFDVALHSADRRRIALGELEDAQPREHAGGLGRGHSATRCRRAADSHEGARRSHGAGRSSSRRTARSICTRVTVMTTESTISAYIRKAPQVSFASRLAV